jgi:uncharacterized protein (TIGR03084 family)
MEMRDLVADLAAEQEALDRVVAGLTPAAWEVPSPADGWLLRDCIAHLAEVDEATVATIRAGQFTGMGRDPGGVLSRGQTRARSLDPAALLAWWRAARAALNEEFSRLDPRARLPWAGPPMSARSMATARLMETWSHGLDVHDAAGAPPTDTDRLRHVAHLGYVTRAFAFRTHGLEPPASDLYVELTAPSGAVWTWGPADATQRITGPAADFCRVVTQRIHPLDTALRSEGTDAATFLSVAQAFAGPPGAGRPPRGG